MKVSFRLQDEARAAITLDPSEDPSDEELSCLFEKSLMKSAEEKRYEKDLRGIEERLREENQRTLGAERKKMRAELREEYDKKLNLVVEAETRKAERRIATAEKRELALLQGKPTPAEIARSTSVARALETEALACTHVLTKHVEDAKEAVRKRTLRWNVLGMLPKLAMFWPGYLFAEHLKQYGLSHFFSPDQWVTFGLWVICMLAQVWVYRRHREAIAAPKKRVASSPEKLKELTLIAHKAKLLRMFKIGTFISREELIRAIENVSTDMVVSRRDCALPLVEVEAKMSEIRDQGLTEIDTSTFLRIADGIDQMGAQEPIEELEEATQTARRTDPSNG